MPKSSSLLAALSALVLPYSVLATEPSGESSFEVFQDPHFQNGLILLDPALGKLVPYGKTKALNDSAEPSWKLAQWSSNFPLDESKYTTLPDGAISYVNQGKTVIMGPEKSDNADLTMGVTGLVEYESLGKNAARKEGEAWPHILVEQSIENIPRLPELQSLTFRVEAKLKSVNHLKTPDYSVNLHSAIFLCYMTVQDVNPESASYNQCVWFCIPIYDDRHRVPPEYMAKDVGKSDATGMFIYTLPGSVYTKDSAHDKKWITLEKDLLPLIYDSIKMAWDRGYLKGNRQLSDYSIKTFAIGWEIPGTFDAEAQIRNLSLKATTSKDLTSAAKYPPTTP
jgi:hypothetical protein